MGFLRRGMDVLRRWSLVLGVAAAARLLYWRLVTPHWRPRADSVQYIGLARKLAAGRGFSSPFPAIDVHPTAFRPPLYPALLAVPSRLLPHTTWPLRSIQVGIGCLVVLLVAVIASSVAGRRAGLVAGVVAALYPPLLANDTIVLTEPLGVALLLGGVIAAQRRRWAWCGLWTGLLLLTRPNGYLIVLVLGGWLWRLLGWRRALAFVGVVVLCVAPWLVRNEVQVGTSSLVTSDGFTLSAMYAPEAQAEGKFTDPVYDARYDGSVFRLAQFDEAAWNRMLIRHALHGIRTHPGYVLHVLGRNSLGYFELDPELNRPPERSDGRNWDFRQATLPFFYVVTVLGVAGFVRHRRRAVVVVLAVLGLQFVALSLLIVAPPRLRTPFDVLCCLGVGLLAARPRPDDPTELAAPSP